MRILLTPALLALLLALSSACLIQGVHARDSLHDAAENAAARHLSLLARQAAPGGGGGNANANPTTTPTTSPTTYYVGGVLTTLNPTTPPTTIPPEPPAGSIIPASVIQAVTSTAKNSAPRGAAGGVNLGEYTLLAGTFVAAVAGVLGGAALV